MIRWTSRFQGVRDFEVIFFVEEVSNIAQTSLGSGTPEKPRLMLQTLNSNPLLLKDTPGTSLKYLGKLGEGTP